MYIEENLQEKMRDGFEASIKKLYPNQDILRYKSGAYRNHDTYRMYMMFCDGYSLAVDHTLARMKA